MKTNEHLSPQLFCFTGELRPTVVLSFFVQMAPGVVIVVCSLGYRSSSIVACTFVSIVNLCRTFYRYKKNCHPPPPDNDVMRFVNGPMLL